MIDIVVIAKNLGVYSISLVIVAASVEYVGPALAKATGLDTM